MNETTTCTCRIAGPLGVGAVLGETPVRKLLGPEGYYSVSLCPLHAAAPRMLDLLKRLTDDKRRRSKFDRMADQTDARAILRDMEG